MLGAIRNAAHTAADTARETIASVTPVSNVSKFADTGQLTPDEFLEAGDKLVAMCPTWRWESGDEPKRCSYLPPTRQFLVTVRVPCLQRVRTLEASTDLLANMEAEDEEGWLATATVGAVDIEAIMSMDDEPEPEAESVTSPSGVATLFDPSNVVLLGVAPRPAARANTDGSDSSDEAPDMEDFEDASLMVDDESTLFAPTCADMVAEDSNSKGDSGCNKQDNIQRTRTYDLEITYDKYYQTPRVWLFGYDEDQNPLGPDQMFEDMSQDHVNRTVTVAVHPHKSMAFASIHPCQHASCMKKITDQLVAGGKAPQVDQARALLHG
jgi:ubiquitin-like-conjugating enzyme ATG3